MTTLGRPLHKHKFIVLPVKSTMLPISRSWNWYNNNWKLWNANSYNFFCRVISYLLLGLTATVLRSVEHNRWPKLATFVHFNVKQWQFIENGTHHSDTPKLDSNSTRSWPEFDSTLTRNHTANQLSSQLDSSSSCHPTQPQLNSNPSSSSCRARTSRLILRMTPALKVA